MFFRDSVRDETEYEIMQKTGNNPFITWQGTLRHFNFFPSFASISFLQKTVQLACYPGFTLMSYVNNSFFRKRNVCRGRKKFKMSQGNLPRNKWVITCFS